MVIDTLKKEQQLAEWVHEIYSALTAQEQRVLLQYAGIVAADTSEGRVKQLMIALCGGASK